MYVGTKHSVRKFLYGLTQTAMGPLYQLSPTLEITQSSGLSGSGCQCLSSIVSPIHPCSKLPSTSFSFGKEPDMYAADERQSPSPPQLCSCCRNYQQGVLACIPIMQCLVMTPITTLSKPLQRLSRLNVKLNIVHINTMKSGTKKSISMGISTDRNCCAVLIFKQTWTNGAKVFSAPNMANLLINVPNNLKIASSEQMIFFWRSRHHRTVSPWPIYFNKS